MTAAVYLAIDECETRFDTLPSGVYFNKILSVLHRRLTDVGVDIGLPHCWYRYGDEVVRYCLPSQVVWSHEAEDRTTVVWEGESPRVLDTQEGARLETEIGQIMDEYPPDSLDALVDRVYSYAPFEFQRSFRYFKERLDLAQFSDIEPRQVAEGILLPNLEKASEDFRSQEFGDLKVKKRACFEVLEQLLTTGSPNLDLALEVAESFWFHYCYYLRLHPRAHENVPVQTRQVWMEKLEAREPSLEGEFADFLERSIQEVPELEENPRVADALDTYRRERERLDELLDETDAWFEGLEEFSRDSQEAYGS